MGKSRRIIRDSVVLVHKVSVKGGVSYTHFNHNSRLGLNERTIREEWQTEKVVNDPVERKRAQSIRAKIVREALKLGNETPLGIVLPEENEQEANDWYSWAQEEARGYNSEAIYTQLFVHMDLFAVRSKNQRTMELLVEDLKSATRDLRRGLEMIEPADIKKAAKKLASFRDIVLPDVASSIEAAVRDAEFQAEQIKEVLKETAYDYEAAQNVVSLSKVDVLRFLEDGMDDLEAPEDGGPSVASGTYLEL